MVETASKATLGTPKAMLVVVQGAEAGRRIPLDGTLKVLGGGDGADEQLADAQLGAKHAHLFFDAGQWVLRDLQGGRGTWVNDLAVEEYVLRDGDRVRMGRTLLKILTAGDVVNRSVEELFRVQTLDGLTLLANKASFHEALVREVARSARHGQPLSLVRLDIDGFGALNAQRGDVAGDIILQAVAARVRGVLRREDVLARIDDDEFAVVLPNCEAADARRVAETLCSAVAGQSFDVEGGALAITVSGGYARLRTRETPDQALERAGIALNRAKQAGGNRVEDSSPWSLPDDHKLSH